MTYLWPAVEWRIHTSPAEYSYLDPLYYWRPPAIPREATFQRCLESVSWRLPSHELYHPQCRSKNFIVAFLETLKQNFFHRNNVKPVHATVTLTTHKNIEISQLLRMLLQSFKHVEWRVVGVLKVALGVLWILEARWLRNSGSLSHDNAASSTF